MLRVIRIQTLDALHPYRESLENLLGRYESTLLDDAHRSGNDQQDRATMLENTISCCPWLWLLIDSDALPAIDPVVGYACLSDVEPGRHAFLHGVSEPAVRRTSGPDRTILALLETAFNALDLLKVKAEYESNNLGAKGFCRRFGFRREALFEADIWVNGQLQDVCVSVLTATEYRQRTQPRLLSRLNMAHSFRELALDTHTHFY